jgi:PAS domain S-box-containing protein
MPEPGDPPPATPREDEARYRAIVDTAVDAIAVIDENGIIQSFNRAAEKLFGYQTNQVVGRNISMLMPEPDHSAHDGYLANYRRTGERKIIGIGREVTGRRSDGSTFPLELSIAEWGDEGRRHFTGIMRDISERKLAEERRQADEAKYRAIVDTAVDAIAVIGEDGIVQAFNRSAEKIFLYPADQVVGRNVRMLMPEPDHSAHDLYLANYHRTGERKIIGIGREVIGRRSDGSTFPLELSIAEWRDEGRRYFTGIMRDITERRQAQEDLRRLTETLEERVAERTGELGRANRLLTEQMESLKRAQTALQDAQKMEAIGRLTGGIAHDFNNLLFAVSGNLAMVADLTKEDARLTSLIDTAQRAASRGARLTQQLLAFARRQPLSPELVRVNELLEEFRLLVQRAVGETIEIDYDLAADLAPALVDPAQLQAAVLNLVVNARDAMPRDGRLSIETRNVVVDAQTPLVTSDMSPGAYVVLAVCDNGSGMPPETAVRAFEPFFTTKEVGKGTGLGLSQVYGFARQSGGWATIDSEPGEGTTVRIYLPRGGDALATATARGAETSWPGHGETILVVEDDPNVIETTVSMLESLGYRTVVATTGRAALVILERGEKVDLIFSDVVMPGGVNGLELAREAAQKYPELGLLLATGYAGSHDDAERALKANLPLLNKPYERAELAAKVRQVLAARR